MRNLALIVLSVSFLIGCSKNKEAGETVEIFDEKKLEQAVEKTAEQIEMETNPVMGFWISDDNSYILNVDKEQTSFTFLSRGAQNQTATLCPNIEITENSVTLNCQLTKNEDFKMLINEKGQLVTTREDMPGFLKRAPNLEITDLMGKWRDEEGNGVGHTIFITDRQENGYVLESFDLNQRAKIYNYYKDEKVTTTFSNGFMFTDQTKDGEYSYYVVEKDDQWYRVVDQTGYSWAYQKFEGDVKKELENEGFTENK